MIQTFTPDHYAIRPVRTHDYEAFYAEEMPQRAALSYPPFGRLVHALVSAEDEDAARAAANTLAAAVRSDPAARGVDMLGPAPCPFARLRGRFRFQLLLKARSVSALRRAAERLVRTSGTLPNGVAARVDSNPMNML